jgi:hypothetical protein
MQKNPEIAAEDQDFDPTQEEVPMTKSKAVTKPKEAK